MPTFHLCPSKLPLPGWRLFGPTQLYASRRYRLRDAALPTCLTCAKVVECDVSDKCTCSIQEIRVFNICMLDDYNIKINLYASSKDYAVVCRLRPFFLHRLFRNSRGNESGIIARNVRLRHKNKRQGKARRKSCRRRTTDLSVSVQRTPPEKMTWNAPISRNMHRWLEVDCKHQHFTPSGLADLQCRRHRRARCACQCGRSSLRRQD